MARYFAFLGLPVEVQYRAGDILLPASGTFVGDTGRSIFLEQNLEQKGQNRHFRWEIPDPCIVRLSEKSEPVASEKSPISQLAVAEKAQSTNAKQEAEDAKQEKSAVDRLECSM